MFVQILYHLFYAQRYLVSSIPKCVYFCLFCLCTLNILLRIISFCAISVCEISFLGHSRFSDKIGSDFQQKNRDRDREWESGVAFAGAEAGHRHAARVNPDSHSRSRKFGIGSRFGSRFGSDFQNREWESGVRNSERQSCYNGHSRLGIEESGVTWKKPLPNPLPIPIGSQNFAHWM